MHRYHTPDPTEWTGRRKVVIHRSNHVYWFGDFLAAMERAGVEVTGHVQTAHSCFGWVAPELIPIIRELPEVRMINDDYAYLVQESDLGLKPPAPEARL